MIKMKKNRFRHFFGPEETPEMSFTLYIIKRRQPNTNACPSVSETARNALRKQLQYIRQPARITEGQTKTQTEIWPLITHENTSGVLSGSDSNRIAPWKDTGWNTKGPEIHSDSIRIAVTKLVSEWLSEIQTNGKGTFITVFTKTLHCFQMMQKDFDELYYKPVMPSKSAYTPI